MYIFYYKIEENRICFLGKQTPFNFFLSWEILFFVRTLAASFYKQKINECMTNTQLYRSPLISFFLLIEKKILIKNLRVGIKNYK